MCHPRKLQPPGPFRFGEAVHPMWSFQGRIEKWVSVLRGLYRNRGGLYDSKILRASSNFWSCLRISFNSSSFSAICSRSLSVCSMTTSTGVFFFHGLRPPLEAAGEVDPPVPACFFAGILLSSL